MRAKRSRFFYLLFMLSYFCFLRFNRYLLINILNQRGQVVGTMSALTRQGSGDNASSFGLKIEGSFDFHLEILSLFPP